MKRKEEKVIARAGGGRAQSEKMSWQQGGGIKKNQADGLKRGGVRKTVINYKTMEKSLFEIFSSSSLPEHFPA